MKREIDKERKRERERERERKRERCGIGRIKINLLVSETIKASRCTSAGSPLFSLC